MILMNTPIISNVWLQNGRLFQLLQQYVLQLFGVVGCSSQIPDIVIPRRSEMFDFVVNQPLDLWEVTYSIEMSQSITGFIVPEE